MTTASPKPSIIRAVDNEPKRLARKWFDAAHVGNDAPRTLPARGPAPVSAFSYPPHAPHVLSGPRDALSASCLDAVSNG